MILSGDLKDFSLADVLQLLLQQRKSGILNLTRGKEKAELFLSGGNVNGVRVNGEGPENKIKEMLLASGKIAPEEMQDLETLSQDMNRSILATLSAKDHLSDEDHKEWLQIITEDMVCELFGWVTGQYQFSTGLKGQGAQAVQLNLSTEFACMEGMRRMDEWPRFKEAIADTRMIFQSQGKAYTGDPESWNALVASLVDGRRSVAQIGKLVPFGSFRLFDCTLNLWEEGFIQPVAGGFSELEHPLAADPQSEKDRRTAMVLGIAMLFLAFGIGVRLVSIWITGFGMGLGNGLAMNSSQSSSTYSSANSPTDFGTLGSSVRYDDRIGNKVARDNIETFIWDYADRKNSLPLHLQQLKKGSSPTQANGGYYIGPLSGWEINSSLGQKPRYKRMTEQTYQLK